MRAADERIHPLTKGTAAVVIVVAAMSFALSYFGLRDLAREVGNLSPALARIYPLVIDLLMIVAYAGTIVLPKGRRRYAWAVLGAYVALSVVGNALSEGELNWAHAAVRAVPPLSLALALHLGLLVGTQLERKPPVKVTPDKVTPDKPAPPAKPTKLGSVSPIKRPVGRPPHAPGQWRETVPPSAMAMIEAGAEATPVRKHLVSELGWPYNTTTRRKAQRWVQYHREEATRPTSLPMEAS